MKKHQQKTIWIDLDNSPHVPFFVPIIRELEKQGHSVLLTARDCFQVCGLADMFGLSYKRAGRHYGKHKVMKLAGIAVRTAQILPTILRKRPDLAVSHGSRAQLTVASLLRIPSVVISDYEHAKVWAVIHPTWVMTPEVIANDLINLDKEHILSYPGIKEDVYVPNFSPDVEIKNQLGLNGKDVVVTVRPPANEAHYHNPESDVLFREVMEVLGRHPQTKIVVLPRNDRQADSVRTSWPRLFESGKAMVPKKVVDGLNLIWYSDLVISGGGTMNREAAALGVPVYSIFRGKIGAVDRYLAANGRMTLVASEQEVHQKIDISRRSRPDHPMQASHASLDGIVGNLTQVLETC